MAWEPDRGQVAKILAAALLAVAVSALLSPTSSRAAARFAIADSWSWPLAPPWRIVGAYVAPPTPYGVGHRGIDLSSALGMPVLAPASGVILFAATVVDRGVISIDHGAGSPQVSNP